MDSMDKWDLVDYIRHKDDKWEKFLFDQKVYAELLRPVTPTGATKEVGGDR